MKLATIPEAAKALDVSESRLRRDVRIGLVPCIMVGNRSLVDVDKLRETYVTRDGMTIEQLSDATGLAVGSIRRAIRDGWLPCWVDGNRYRFSRDDVEQAIQERMKGKPGRG